MARNAAGIVFGLYQRCGLGVELGKPRRSCTVITFRAGFGDADSIFVHEAVVATPFWMICVELTSCATSGFDSNEEFVRVGVGVVQD